MDASLPDPPNPRTLLPPRGPVPQRTNFPPPLQISPTEAYYLPTYPPTHLPTYLVQPRFLSTRIIRIRVEKDTEERGRRRRRTKKKKVQSPTRKRHLSLLAQKKKHQQPELVSTD